MALQGLGTYTYFSVEDFIEDKLLVFVKATPWYEDNKIEGSKVLVQIVQDNSQYNKSEHNNFGGQFTVKVRNVPAPSYQNYKPFQTQVTIVDVERASVWGDYRNELSIIASVQPVEAGK